MSFNLPPFGSFLINVLITKIERFLGGLSLLYGLLIEEANVVTVDTINQRRDNSFLNAELLLLRHSGCSVSNE